MKMLRCELWMLVASAAVSCAPTKKQPPIRKPDSEAAKSPPARVSTYRGWKTLELNNSVIKVQIVPDIGGRVIQFSLDDFEYMWVNDALAGKTSPETGLAPDGSWLNYGGEKLWPAPQGWGSEDHWPGPPDAVLDGMPHEAKILKDVAAVQLTSQDDKRSGIRFSRIIKIFEDSTRVSIDATMKNIDTRPRRWGIWSNAQPNAANARGNGPNDKTNVYCPINPKSIFPRGYGVQFGLANNPQFKPDYNRGLMRVHSERLVGKVGLDSHAGWLATVDGTAGYVFVQRFTFHPDKPYPHNSSVAVWLQGKGTIVAWNKMMQMPDDPAENPYLVECEVLSPLAGLSPGESYSFHYDWYAAKIGGDYPVLACTDAGVTCEPFTAEIAARPPEKAGKLALCGRFGVFHKGSVGIAFLDASGKKIGQSRAMVIVDPRKELVLSASKLSAIDVPQGAATAVILVIDTKGETVGEMARAAIRR